MQVHVRRKKLKEAAGAIISPAEWGGFLDDVNARYRGWLVRLETHDVVTGERVVSQELPLQSIELDLEDEKNPRINVTVQEDNKLLKHILFRPSCLVLISSVDDQEQLLQVETVNTETTIHFRAPIAARLA